MPCIPRFPVLKVGLDTETAENLNFIMDKYLQCAIIFEKHIKIEGQIQMQEPKQVKSKKVADLAEILIAEWEINAKGKIRSGLC